MSRLDLRHRLRTAVFVLALAGASLLTTAAPSTAQSALGGGSGGAGVAAAQPAEGDPATAALPGITCRSLYKNGQPTGAVECPVRTGAWTYYQAWVTQRDSCSQTSFTSSTVRFQFDARKGGSSMHIGGVWAVLGANSSRRFGITQYSFVDGLGRAHNDARNNNGGFGRDVTDSYTGDPQRFGYTRSNYVALPWGAAGQDATLRGQLNLANHPQPYLSQGTCTALPLYVIFRR